MRCLVPTCLQLGSPATSGGHRHTGRRRCGSWHGHSNHRCRGFYRLAGTGAFVLSAYSKHYPYLRRHQYFLVSLLGLAIFLGVVFTAVSSETAITWAALGVLLGSIVLHWIELWLSWSRNAQGLHLLLIAIAFIIAVSLLLSLWRDCTVSNAVLFFVVSLVAMLVTIIISAQARAAGRDRKDQEAHQEKCRALGIARGRKEAQKDAARRRIGALDNAEIARRSEQLLDNLYHTMVRGSDQFIDITDMAQEGDEVGDIWFLARRLAALGDIKVSNSDDAGWTEILELTAQGFNRAATAGDPASRAEVSIGRLNKYG